MFNLPFSIFLPPHLDRPPPNPSSWSRGDGQHQEAAGVDGKGERTVEGEIGTERDVYRVSEGRYGPSAEGHLGKQKL